MEKSCFVHSWNNSRNPDYFKKLAEEAAGAKDWQTTNKRSRLLRCLARSSRPYLVINAHNLAAGFPGLLDLWQVSAYLGTPKDEKPAIWVPRLNWRYYPNGGRRYYIELLPIA